MKEHRAIKTVCVVILKLMITVLLAVAICTMIETIARFFTPTVDASKRKHDTLVIVEGSGHSDTKVVYDRDTKVLYYYVYKGGLFPLYNADGSLKLYEGD